MKKFTAILALSIVGILLVGCGAAEPEVEVPTSQPGDGGPQPSSVGAAAGGQPEPAGGVSTPGTE